MMATRSMDRFSELPSEILDKILGLLDIQEAARMAILSKFWREMWFNLTDLNFDCNFFYHIEKKYSSAYSHFRTKTTKTETINSDILTSAGMCRYLPPSFLEVAKIHLSMEAPSWKELSNK
ncbi:unnamed protein product [Cuscuta europaea]|nr:unnamed protein product [Cuscuta europaea]